MAFPPQTQRTGFPKRGFTLVELLVVVAVIGVLASIAISALPAMLENGRRAQCQSRLANLGRALLLYAQDHQMTLPSSTNPAAAANPFVSAAYTYTADILPYLGLTEEQAKADRNLFRCPSRKYEPQSGSFEVSHYAFNGLLPPPLGLAGVRLPAIERPSRTVLLAEGAAAAPFSNHPFRGMNPVQDAKCWLFLWTVTPRFCRFFRRAVLRSSLIRRSRMATSGHQARGRTPDAIVVRKVFRSSPNSGEIGYWKLKTADCQ